MNFYNPQLFLYIGVVRNSNQERTKKGSNNMSNFSTWMIAIFMIMFWIFRAIVALCTQYSIDFLGLEAYNFNLEVIIAFATVICIVLVVKRIMAGSLIYLVIYGVYFGEHLVANLITLLQGNTALTVDASMNLISDLIAIVLALFSVVDMLVDKGRKVNPIDKKTDWYFKNEKYDEELKGRDQREDKNEYKFY